MQNYRKGMQADMIPLLVNYIKQQTAEYNKNNVTRTKAYLSFYEKYPEIKWAFLASFVSRNAGWNMTDLQTQPYIDILSEEKRKSLYLTYESINWYIFQDAYPQLLIYQLSREKNTPLFFLLKHFHVSEFMEYEWYQFYLRGNEKRLIYAQIINEQNVVEQPIMDQFPYEQKVFRSIPFMFQNFAHYSAVILPTEKGKLYGDYVSHFLNVSSRIKIGKKIANLLFFPYLYPQFLSFARNVEVTGSRFEYEQFMGKTLIKTKPLMEYYRNTEHQLTEYKGDWSKKVKIKHRWWKDTKLKNIKRMDETFYNKRKLLLKMTNMDIPLNNESVEKS
ncbi:DUF2515 family protein [Bacillaceae bacterium W0354]